MGNDTKVSRESLHACEDITPEQKARVLLQDLSAYFNGQCDTVDDQVAIIKSDFDAMVDASAEAGRAQSAILRFCHRRKKKPVTRSFTEKIKED